MGSEQNEKIGLFSYRPQPTLQPSTHCLFISLFTYAKRLLKPTHLPDWRLSKLRDLPKTAKRVVQLQPNAITRADLVVLQAHLLALLSQVF